MAPTLKEVNASNSAAAVATRGEIIHEEHPVIAIHPVTSSSDHSNEELADSNNNDDQLDCAASTDQDQAARKETMAMCPTVQREVAEDVPPDETAFLVRPHFSTDDPFHRNLSGLDLSMRCAICSELFRAPVTLLPCLHNFCSLCVRNHFKATYTGMKRKANCPQCHEPVRMPGSSDYEKGILPNKRLEQQVDIYKNCRGQLREKLVKLDVLEKEKALGILVQSSEQAEGTDGKNSAHRRRKREKVTEDRGSRSSKRVKRTAVYDSDDGDHDNNDEDYNDACNRKMASASPIQAEAKSQLQQPKRKPTVSYHSMNKKKLAELCRREGLEAHGNENELKQRHSDFITLHNSQCDSEHPLSVKELVKEIKNREKSIKREASASEAKQANKFMKKFGHSLDDYHEGSVGRPTSGNKSFDTEVKSKFAKMIADVKKRSQAKSETNNSIANSEGNVRSSGSNGVHGAASVNHEANVSQASMAPPQQSAGILELESGDAGPITSAASIESDKTIETPEKLCQSNNCDLASGPSSKPKLSVAKQRISPQKRLKSSKCSSRSTGNTSSSRVASIGPWTCKKCTFENVRNTTRKARCEMCDAVRPHESDRLVEVLNIDC